LLFHDAASCLTLSYQLWSMTIASIICQWVVIILTFLFIFILWCCETC
jgi:hypothetical protein